MSAATLAKERPLYLGIETINTCNAKCVFCVYTSDSRPREIMSMALYEKILGDYVAAGGGALSFSPLTGDILLDRFFAERLVQARAEPSIGDIWFHTNAIAWKRLPEARRRTILENVNQILVSFGGADRQTYASLMGVDAWERAVAALHDMICMRNELSSRVEIAAVVRDRTPPCAEGLATIAATGVDRVAVDTFFHNWGGALSPPLASPTGPLPSGPRRPCATLSLAPMVLVDGRVTACGCANPGGKQLVLGSIREESLGALWRNAQWAEMIAAFHTSPGPEICPGCTYYTDADTIIAHPKLQDYRLGENPWTKLDAY